MKTLALSGGDLVVSSTGHQTISGTPKIRQELALSLGEEYGGDKYHPDFGSILDDFFGEPINDLTQASIEAEVIRVIQQYISIQQQQVLQDHLAQRATRFDASDVVTGVSGVTAEVSYDTIKVTATLQTAAGTSVTVNRTVQP